MSEWESRLYRRIEELVASSDDDDPSRDHLLGLERALASTRGEVSAIRADLAGLRDAVTVLVGKATDDSDSAIAALRGQIDSLTAVMRRQSHDDTSAAGQRSDAVQRAVSEARDVVEQRIV